MGEGANTPPFKALEPTVAGGCAVVHRLVGHTVGVRTRSVQTAAAVLSILLPTACSNEPTRSVDGFCKRLRVEQTLLSARLTDKAQVQPLVARFRALDARAPEQIRDEWHQITTLVEKAAATDASVEAQTELVELALATDRSVAAVKTYASNTCQVPL
jgi:hypothetical protein